MKGPVGADASVDASVVADEVSLRVHLLRAAIAGSNNGGPRQARLQSVLVRGRRRSIVKRYNGVKHTWRQTDHVEDSDVKSIPVTEKDSHGWCDNGAGHSTAAAARVGNTSVQHTLVVATWSMLFCLGLRVKGSVDGHVLGRSGEDQNKVNGAGVGGKDGHRPRIDADSGVEWVRWRPTGWQTYLGSGWCLREVPPILVPDHNQYRHGRIVG